MLIYSVLLKHCPKYQTNHISRNSFKNKSRIISRKIRRYNKLLSGSHCSSFSHVYKSKINYKIAKLQNELKQSYFDKRKAEEDNAIDKIKSDNKYFYKYANRFKKLFICLAY